MSKRKKPADPAVCGVLPVDKEPGPTSHDIVDVARRAMGTRQVGHTGTLDPAARGLLALCIGPYTKLVPFLINSDKTYTGTIGLGLATDTDDLEGLPVSAGDASALTLEKVREAAAHLTGAIVQMPPKYSAVKVAGKKLYEYAREDEEVEVDPREVTVHSLDFTNLRLEEVPTGVRERGGPDAAVQLKPGSRVAVVDFITRVSSGTYVRALARDLGAALGVGGVLMSLERTAIGHISLDQAVPSGALAEDPLTARQYLIRGAAALDPSRYPILTLMRGYVRRLMNGQPLNDRMMENLSAASAVPSGAVCGIAGEDGELLAIVTAERFDAMRRANPYDSRFDVHFKPIRIFPGGLK